MNLELVEHTRVHLHVHSCIGISLQVNRMYRAHTRPQAGPFKGLHGFVLPSMGENPCAMKSYFSLLKKKKKKSLRVVLF